MADTTIIQKATECTMNASNLIYIFGTLLLAIISLWGPLFRKWLIAPKLQIRFTEEPPLCHLTSRVNGTDVYYFRFAVKNVGKSQAKLCEAVLEELWVENAAGKLVKEPNFSPVSLIWSVIRQQFMHINPEREQFCDLGHLSDSAFQNHPQSQEFLNSLPQDRNVMKFFFDQQHLLFSQKAYLVPGKYRVKVSVYSENARKISIYFRVAWSGVWKSNEKDQFKELVIENA